MNHLVKQKNKRSIGLLIFLALMFVFVSCSDISGQISVEQKNNVSTVPRSLSENREPTAEKPFWPDSSIKFVKYAQYSPYFIEKSDSKRLSLVTASILGQAPSVVHEPIEMNNTSVDFVNNEVCKNCHEKQFNDWMGSHHEQAMKVATQTSVLGDFDNAHFTDAGITSRFFRRKGKFFINTKNADNEYADFEVKYTFGITPLQQYLLAFPKGRLQAFTVAWNTKEKRWFSLYPDEKINPGNFLHWTSRGFTANSSCIECHTTNMSLNYDVETKTYNSSWSEVNVSCQSCHGAGARHVEWAKTETKEKGDDRTKGLQVDYGSLSAKEQVDRCARCHSRRYSVSENDSHEETFFDNFMPELLREGLYHADGQIIEEVYVYGSFIQSKMYYSGVGCLDCHNPHTLKLRQQGNALCVNCHQNTPPKEKFSRLLSKDYDTPQHHFHTKKSAGAQCVNCHMPEKTYMQFDQRRDHRFSIPRPDLSLKWATPNACTHCHTDKSTQWAIEMMDKWYGKAWQKRPTITGIIAKARAGVALAEIPLFEVIRDLEQPAIVRATALDLMGQYGARGMNAMLTALTDESPLVRVNAVQGLEKMPDKEKFQLLAPMLSDPVRGVRIEVARMLATVPESLFNSNQQKKFTRALEEYKSAQLAQSDHPEGHLNLANLYIRLGKIDLAESAFHTAIERDNYFLPAYTGLSGFYYRTGRKKEAEETFYKALQFLPKQGELHYSLGLLFAEQQRFSEADSHFSKATELMPGKSRLYYNYGLFLQKAGKLPQAEKALQQSHEIVPDNRDTLIALIMFYRQQQKWKEALVYAKQLNQLYPDAPSFSELLNTIQQEVMEN